MDITKLIIAAIVAVAICSFACKEEPCDASADYDGNGFVTTADFGLFLDLFRAGDPAADLNCDGEVDDADGDAFQEQLGQ